ncbi:LLM class flavin-dependent oxidoreductase [Streptomyces fuscichromogenes]|uniref:LLM class flavin-dependent oxidoreductase n=1 Tax=Streptomyces fuscichromogenes TaxID=1324013 RepID=UPI0038105943
MKYSLLDVAWVGADETPADALRGAVPLAQAAERSGYQRVWYAEHHNMPQIASAATSVLIAHVAAHTERIRVGAGGVMLPNHAPLVIAEQFGTLAALHPGRIDLGLGRAAGSDRHTARALRLTAAAAESFPQDVLALQGFLRGEPTVPGVRAVPGHGTDVALYILGSSLFGARLAATLGVPYAFAAHFAPLALDAAAETYRSAYRPSPGHPEPYLIVTANLIAADSEEQARHQQRASTRYRARTMLPRGRHLTDAEVNAVLDSPEGQHLKAMNVHTAVGRPSQVTAQLAALAARTEADELMLAPAANERADRIRSVELVPAPAPGRAARSGTDSVRHNRPPHEPGRLSR